MTTNAGANWTVVHADTEPSASCMGIRVLNDKEVPLTRHSTRDSSSLLLPPLLSLFLPPFLPYSSYRNRMHRPWYSHTRVRTRACHVPGSHPNPAMIIDSDGIIAAARTRTRASRTEGLTTIAAHEPSHDYHRMIAACCARLSQAFAACGNLVTPGLTGRYWHTRDGGGTWTLDALKVGTLCGRAHRPSRPSTITPGVYLHPLHVAPTHIHA